MNRLHSASNASPFVHDLLDLVQHDMLDVDGAKRITSAQLVSKLEMMHSKCSDDPNYAQPAPRRKTSRSSPRTMGSSEAALQCYRSISVNMVRLPNQAQQSRTWPGPLEYYDAAPASGVGAETRSSTMPWSFQGTANAPYQLSCSTIGEEVSNPFGDMTYALSPSESIPMPNYHQPATVAPTSNKRHRASDDGSKKKSKRRKANASTAQRVTTSQDSDEGEDRSLKSVAGSSSDRLFACPYFKHDREKYGTKRWNSCGGPGWTISRLK